MARLATFDPGEGPHIVPVCFVYDGCAFYTAVDRKPKRVAPERLARVRNIQAQPRVALLIDHYDEKWSRLWYVLIRGKAQLIPTSAHAERARALRRLRYKYPQYTRDILPDEALIIRIRPEQTMSWGKIWGGKTAFNKSASIRQAPERMPFPKKKRSDRIGKGALAVTGA